MIYTIGKSFTFCAAHTLYKHKGKCGKLHGHTYTVTLILESHSLNDEGMVMDYGTISEVFCPYMEKHLDHCNLNEWIDNPTAEEIAIRIFTDHKHLLPRLVKVRIEESPSTFAEVGT